jgi:uncharacterized protein
VRERILAFVGRLRAQGIEISPAEVLDGLAAVEAVGVERPLFREALATTLVKDEGDRPAFERLFDEAFPLRARGEAAPDSGGRGRRRGRRAVGGGADGGTASARGAAGERGGGGAAAPGATPAAGARSATPSDATTPGTAPSDAPGRDASPSDAGGGRARGDGAAERPDRDDTRRGHDDAGSAAGDEAHGPGRARAARRRELLARPLRELTARDVAEARELVRELGRRLRGRLARRRRQARRGTLDFRRTIRAAMSTGGTPLRPRLRRRRPGRPDLVALCDLSGSVAAASELLLGLVAPAAEHFRRVDLFAYVDRPVPVSIEGGHVAPDGLLDLHARSDFGRVLAELLDRHGDLLGRGTLLLVLGDARNNRLPARADLLRAVRERVRAIVWLVPEPRARWNTGDSDLGRYAAHATEVHECLDLGALVRAVRRVL